MNETLDVLKIPSKNFQDSCERSSLDEKDFTIIDELKKNSKLSE